MKKDTPNICRFRGEVCRKDREAQNRHKSAVFWFTGLSGSGKSTIAHGVEKKLFDLGIKCVVFDGDNVRHGLCGDLSFSPEGRAENLRRIAEVARLFVENGTVCLCAFISPLEADRAKARSIVGQDDFHEIYVQCPVEVCEERDVKGYYKMAREGKIKNYTGISAPYEEPVSPEFRLETAAMAEEDSVQAVFDFVISRIDHS